MLKRLIVCGHRGFPSKFPENTLVAFENALKLDIGSMEYDLHLTKDKQLVVTHDDSIERCSNGKGNVADLTLEELRRFDFGSWKDGRFTGEKIPLFTEVLDLVERQRPGMFQLIEVKRPDVECADAAMKELVQRGMTGKFTLVSFHWNVLKEMKRRYPEIILHGNPPEEKLYDGAYFEGISRVGLYHTTVTPEVVAHFHSMNILVDSWVVNSEDVLEKALAAGVDSITSNTPDEMIRLLRNRGIRTM